MELYDLDELVSDLKHEPTSEQLEEIFNSYAADFIDNPFIFKGYTVKFINVLSKIPDYEAYPETFVHLITRKGKGNHRVFDKLRANRIHWIRCILENHTMQEITYFEYPEPDGKLREYYWYKDEDFLVIMQYINPNYAIVTCFHVDGERNRKYFSERESWYKNQA